MALASYTPSLGAFVRMKALVIVGGRLSGYNNTRMMRLRLDASQAQGVMFHASSR